MASKKKNKGNSTNPTKTKEFSKNQVRYLEILKKNAGRVQASCNKARIHRTTHYEWMKDKAFKKEVEEILDGLKDLVEGKIISHIQSPIPRVSADMCKFYAKTKMRDRGYGDHQEIEFEGNINSSTKEERKAEIKRLLDK